jgi:hypothetical protein
VREPPTPPYCGIGVNGGMLGAGGRSAMRSVWVMATATALLVACAGGKSKHEMAWMRDDGTPTDRVQLQRDNAACRNEAGFPPTSTEDAWLYTYKNCMRSLGWVDANAKN